MSFVKYVQVGVYDNASDLTTGNPTADKGSLAIGNDLMKLFQYNGTNWTSFGTINIKRSTVAVNGKTTGATKVYTTENTTLNFYPILVVYRAVNVSGITTPATISVGTNSTSYNNISQASLLSTILATLGATSGQTINTVSSPISGNTDIYANVTIGAIATNYTVYVEVIGFYDN